MSTVSEADLNAAAPPPSSEPAFRSGPGWAAVAAALGPLLLLLAWRPGAAIAAVVLATTVTTLVLGWRYRRAVAATPMPLAASLAGQALSILLMIPDGQPSGASRLLAVLVLSSVLALLGLVLLDRRGGLPGRWGRLAVPILAALLVLVEMASSILPGAPHTAFGNRGWTSVMVPDSSLGMRQPGGALLESTFPDDPNGDFTPVDHRATTWQLNVAGGSLARLVFPPDSVRHLRVEVDRHAEGPGWHIQLSRSMLALEQLRGYSVSLRIRADRPRSVIVGYGQGYPPWQVTAFYRAIEITPEWQTFQEFFLAGETDDNTRLFLDINDDSAAVELADVEVRNEDGGFPVEPPVEGDRYLVRHAFNALGCRDDEPESASTRSTRRVLVLGDEAAMGLYVRREDTFAARLTRGDHQALDGGAGFDVINCGVPGYGTHEALAFHGELAPVYHPDIVLLVLRPGANNHHREQRARQALDRAGRLGRLFTWWSRLALGRVDSPSGGYDPSVADIQALHERVRADGGQLVVALFRTTHERGWDALHDALVDGMGDTGVPLVDLGTALADVHPDDELYSYNIGSPPNALAHRLAAEALAEALAPLTGP